MSDPHRFPHVIDQPELDQWEEDAATDAALDQFLWALTRVSWWTTCAVALWLAFQVVLAVMQ